VSGARAGRTYKFKVEARNVIGYSPKSEKFVIKAAIVPTQPRSLTLTRQLNDVVLEWSSPTDDALTDFGDELAGYNIHLKTKSGLWV